MAYVAVVGDEHELQSVPFTSTAASSTSRAASPVTDQNTTVLVDEGTAEGTSLLQLSGSGPATQRQSVASPEQDVWRTVEQFWRNSWASETFCIVLVAGSLMAIWIVLWMTQGKPRPHWPMGISVNALIAIFLVLLKAGISLPVSEGLSQLKWQSISTRPRQLLDIQDYDSASRGAWGSLQFLLKPDMLDFDDDGIVWYNPKTWLPVLQVLKPRRQNFGRYFAKFAALITVLTFIADPFAQQLVEYVDCSIDNLDVPATLSRAVVHLREGGRDRHGNIVVSQPELGLDLAITVGTTFPPKNVHSLVDTDCPSNNCNFPRFETLGICHTCRNISSEIRSSPNPKTMCNAGRCYNHTLVDDRNQTYAWADDQFYPLNTTTYRGGIDNTFHMKVLNSGRWNSKPVAFDCELYPCVKEYTASIRDAALTEELVTTTRIPKSLDAYQLVATRTLRNGIWEDCVVDQATKLLPDDCTWYLYSGGRLEANLAVALGGQYMQVAGKTVMGSTVARKLWNNGSTSMNSLDNYFGHLADVLTATIRNTGNKNMNSSSADYPEPIYGVARVRETCMDVRWEWLSFLVAITGLMLLFWSSFLLYHNTRSKNPAWKSSSLALLFCSLDDKIKDSVKGYPTKDAMIEAAKTSTVQLIADSDGKVSLEEVSHVQ